MTAKCRKYYTELHFYRNEQQLHKKKPILNLRKGWEKLL